MIPPLLLKALEELAPVLGERGIVRGDECSNACRDWRGLYQGRTAAVLRPNSTAALSEALQICARYGVQLVPQGGNTGLVGGAVPDDTARQLVVSLGRMNRVRQLDPLDCTLTVEAGITLAAARDHAAAADLHLPLSIASEGSAQIGGVLATNAGGNHTLRWGNARELVLGLEVVLPDGRVLNDLRRLRKDNTGYALRHLFVGSEGTLGIISAAVLQMVPRPRSHATSLCALPGRGEVLEMLRRCRRAVGPALHAFEYVSGSAMRMLCEQVSGASIPLPSPADHYVLLELAGLGAEESLRESLEVLLAEAMEASCVTDAAIAQSHTQRAAIWRLREEQSEAQRLAGASVKNDVSVPVSSVPDFLAEATIACEIAVPGCRVAPFGHVGDGNIHFNVVQPKACGAEEFMQQAHTIAGLVNDIVRRFDGSFSAEHGIGQLKRETLAEWRVGPHLDLMRAIKQAVDPQWRMNPGKVFL